MDCRVSSLLHLSRTPDSEPTLSLQSSAFYPLAGHGSLFRKLMERHWRRWTKCSTTEATLKMWRERRRSLRILYEPWMARVKIRWDFCHKRNMIQCEGLELHNFPAHGACIRIKSINSIRRSKNPYSILSISYSVLAHVLMLPSSTQLYCL